MSRNSRLIELNDERMGIIEQLEEMHALREENNRLVARINDWETLNKRRNKLSAAKTDELESTKNNNEALVAEMERMASRLRAANSALLAMGADPEAAQAPSTETMPYAQPIDVSAYTQQPNYSPTSYPGMLPSHVSPYTTQSMIPSNQYSHAIPTPPVEMHSFSASPHMVAEHQVAYRSSQPSPLPSQLDRAHTAGPSTNKPRPSFMSAFGVLVPDQSRRTVADHQPQISLLTFEPRQNANDSFPG
jgi:hypothetical protein